MQTQLQAVLTVIEQGHRNDDGEEGRGFRPIRPVVDPIREYGTCREYGACAWRIWWQTTMVTKLQKGRRVQTKGRYS